MKLLETGAMEREMKEMTLKKKYFFHSDRL